MNSQATEGGFNTANPHALATILEASETRSIIAATDIFDVKGIKLWARDQPVSRELQRKLMDRSLSKPLESCLSAEDGVSGETLRQGLQRLVESDNAISPLLRPHAAALIKGVNGVRLHPVVQLLLTASESARPKAFEHALEAMAVAGALMKASGGDERLVTMAMTAGLLHDIGEMYVAPEYGEADAEASLDVACYRQLVVHPHIGQLLLSQLTDYTKDIVRAVAEHHEHLDGSGYPHRLTADRISPLGKLLAATEMGLTALRHPGANLFHASVALRVVPGEFDEHLAGPLAAAARSVPPVAAKREAEALKSALAQLDWSLQASMNRIDALLPPEPGEGLQRAANLTRYLLHKLRQGWNESGLWSPEGIAAEQAAEAEAVVDDLRGRLSAISRVARLSAGDLGEEEQACLDALCEQLTSQV